MNIHGNTYDVHMNSAYNTLRVDEAGYQEIRKLAWEHSVCETCYNAFSEDNPMISRIECLQCFKKREKLDFIGLIPFTDPEYGGVQNADNPYGVRLYQHMNRDGWIFESKAGPGRPYDATRESIRTLKYWGFPVPEKAVLPNNKEISCEYFFWSIYGNLRSDPVLAIEHGNRIYSNEVVFFVQRNGNMVQLSRRKALHRKLLEAAKIELEKYKDKRGEYDVWGAHKAWLLEQDVYHMAANLALQFHIFPTRTDIIQQALTK